VTSGAAPRRVRLWDAPVRIVHWSFVLLIPALWWTWRQGRMGLHETLGYVLLALLLFRLFWGFAGSGPARFASFVRGPRAILAYLTGRGARTLGHNPIGGWSVLALLGLMLAEVAAGLFTQDTDGIESGPLTRLISYEQADAARGWHRLGFYLILAMVAVHVAAILFYLVVKRDNLVAPMITGRKAVDADEPEPALAPAWRIAAGALAAGLIAFWVAKGCAL
jgi:cytochrome b